MGAHRDDGAIDRDNRRMREDEGIGHGGDREL